MPPKPSRPHIPLDPGTRAQVAAWAREHWDAVFGLLYRLTNGRRHEAEDLAQETFLRAAARHASFEPGTQLRAWLMRIAVNANADRRRRRDDVLRAEPLPDDAPASDAAPQDRVAGQELFKALEAALAELPETARTVFLLRTREGLAFRDIAGVIETSEETARWHMLQARRQLLKSLGDWI